MSRIEDKPATIQLAVDAIRAALQVTGGKRICFSRLDESFKMRGLTQNTLKTMAKNGYLTRGELSRGESRRYYDITGKFEREFMFPRPTAA